jgi:GT2 family glycosyltransferase
VVCGPLNLGIDVIDLFRRVARIMRHDYQKGNGTFRILWKSAARWRRLGWDGMLEWLDKEIWKLPNPQTILEIETKAYERWISQNELPSYSAEIDQRIKFSVFVIAGEGHKAANDFFNSLQQQTHANWEMIVIGDRLDLQLSKPGIMTASRDEALDRATGEWGVMVDDTMVLSPHFFAEMAYQITRNENAALIYCDEDRIDAEGVRSNPYFKSGFNPDLFYSTAYIGKGFTWKIETLRTIGGLGTIDRLKWDFDLALQVWEREGDRAICHLPKVLCHLARNDEQWFDSGKEILIRHFERQKIDAAVEEGKSPLTYRISWPKPEPLPMASIIIPTRDQREILQQCVDSIIAKTLYPRYEIIIVDNQSAEPATLEYLNHLGQQDNIRVLPFDKPFNYSAINNDAVQQAIGEIVVLLNNDVEVISPDWLDELVMHASRKEIGCVGAMLYYPDDTIQHAGIICGLGDVAGHAHKYMIRGSRGYFERACTVQNTSAVTGACLAVRKEVYQEVGGLNETDLTVAYNDVDFCLKVMETGYKNLWTPYAQLYHYESKSRGKDNTPEKKARYQKEVSYMKIRWPKYLEHDPYYHQAFTKTAEQFQLRRMKP